MVLSNHVVYNLLMDNTVALAMVEKAYPSEFKLWKENKDNSGFREIFAMYKFLNADYNKNFVVTQSALDVMADLKIDKINWKFLHGIPDGKRTYIFPNSSFLRMKKQNDQIAFCYGGKKKKEDGDDYLQYTIFYIDTLTGEEHIKHIGRTMLDVDNLIVFKQICFLHLSETIEEIVAPGKIHGTRKTGKTNNDLPFAVTIVNSKWNVTSIRTDNFGVRGHFRVQPCGPGRAQHEIIFIDPFTKNGYKREAGKKNNL